MKVVLVENDRNMQRELTRMVQALGGGEVVATWETARSAIQWFDEHPHDWDLAIIDMFLNEGHGFEVLRRCRRTAGRQHAVMLSNYGRDDAEAFARAAGADRFFDKSTDLDALMLYCKSLGQALDAARPPLTAAPEPPPLPPAPPA